MPIARETRADAVEFLVALVCGAPEGHLLEAWRRLGRDGTRPATMEEAARLQVRSALGRFCEKLPARDLDETAETAVTAMAFCRSRSDAAIALALSLCRSAYVQRKRVVVVKGAGLCLAGAYAGDREVGDADVVVDPEDVPAWRRAAGDVGAAWEPAQPGGYEVSRITRSGALVELHVALPGDGGHVSGPGFDEVWPRSVPVEERAATELRVPCRSAAREISVHHAVFHHRGDAEYVLRALQDVARLEAGEGDEGEGLYRREDVRSAVAFFRRLAVEWVVRRPQAQGVPLRGELVEGLLREDACSKEERFVRGVDNWLEANRREGHSVLRFALQQAFTRDAGPKRLFSRLSGLVGRYAAGRLGRGAARRRREEESWIRFLTDRGAPPPAS